MDSVYSELSKPTFWAFGVVLAIIINLASSYIKGPLDSILSATSSRWRTRSETKKAMRLVRIELAALSALEREHLSRLEVRRRIQSVSFYVQVALLLVVYTLVRTWDSSFTEIVLIKGMLCFSVVLSFFGGFATHREAADIALTLQEAHKLQDLA